MDVAPGFKRTDIGVIPEQWDVIPMSELVTEFRGGAPLKPSDFTTAGVKVLPKGGVGRTGWLNVRADDIQYCSPGYASAHRNNQVDKSYAIVVLRDLVPSGPSIGLIVRIKDAETYVLAQGVYGFKVNDRVDSQFLVHLSNTRWYRQVMNSIMVGSTQVHITNEAFKSARIPLPSIDEQRAIAKALGDVDALLDGLERLLAKKRDLKQAAMQQLLTGQTRLPGFSGEWSSAQLDQIAKIRNEKVISSLCPGGTKCIELDAIEQGRGRLIGWSEVKGYSSKYVFKAGDVLFGRLRAYLRKYWFAEFDGICSTEIWPLIPRDERLSNKYLHLIAQTDPFYDLAGISYGTHMPRSDWSVLGKLVVRLPAYDEQVTIAEIVFEMDTELTALEARRNKTHALKQAMMQELLTGRIRLVIPEQKAALQT